MVSYQRWTSIAFEVAREKGAQFDSLSSSSDGIQVFADIWNDRKDELSAASVQEARQVAREEISV